MPVIDPEYPDIAIELTGKYGFQPSGIIHVGANRGGESAHYAAIGAAPVLYVEAIPEVCDDLERNVSRFPGHHALQAVCGSETGLPVTFNVASNPLATASSYLPIGDIMARHRPDIHYVRSFTAETITLADLLARHGFQASQFNLLVLDVQGAELDVLKGATRVISNCEFIVSEVSDYELYKGGCTLTDVSAYLDDLGFTPVADNLKGNVGRRVGDVLYGLKVSYPARPEE